MNKLSAKELAYIEEEVAEEEEEEYNEDEEEEENDNHVDDACMWHNPFLDRYNLEMEILDEHVDLVDVPVGVSVVGDEESMQDIPLPEGVGSIPCNVVSGKSSDASFPDGSDLEVNQMFETKDELQTKLHDVAVRGNFEYKVVKSNKWLYVVECIIENCKWRVRGSKLPNFGRFIIRKY